MLKTESFRSVVLDHLTGKVLTHIDLCDVTGKSPMAVNNALSALHHLQLIHVSEYRSNGKRIVKAFTAGRGVDAERPEGSLAMLNNGPAMLLKLEGGDYTRVELSAMLGQEQRQTYAILQHLLETNQVHVARYAQGVNNQRVAVYRAGPGKSVASPPKKSEPARPPAAKDIPRMDPLTAALFGRACA